MLSRLKMARLILSPHLKLIESYIVQTKGV
nr:MAG TPA: hypothetical protein [Caudoviricetes sp.]